MLLVPNSTHFYNPNYPSGVLLDTNALTTTGFNIGDYAPSENAFIEFSVALPFEDSLQCGATELDLSAVIQPAGLAASSDSAIVDVPKHCGSS
jgi:hypothetical protein